MTDAIHMLGAADARAAAVRAARARGSGSPAPGPISALDQKIAARTAKAQATMARPDVQAVMAAASARARVAAAQAAPVATAQEGWLSRRALGPIPGYGVVVGGAGVLAALGGALWWFARRAR